MHLLRAPLAKPDIRISPIGSLESSLARRLSCKDSNLVAILASEGEVSCFILFRGYDEPS